jgi:hypothetical protein
VRSWFRRHHCCRLSFPDGVQTETSQRHLPLDTSTSTPKPTRNAIRLHGQLSSPSFFLSNPFSSKYFFAISPPICRSDAYKPSLKASQPREIRVLIYESLRGRTKGPDRQQQNNAERRLTNKLERLRLSTDYLESTTFLLQHGCKQKKEIDRLYKRGHLNTKEHKILSQIPRPISSRKQATRNTETSRGESSRILSSFSLKPQRRKAERIKTKELEKLSQGDVLSQIRRKWMNNGLRDSWRECLGVETSSTVGKRFDYT